MIFDLQSNDLPTESSPQRGYERFDIRVGYISFLARLTRKIVEVNTQYHALRIYRFMLMFVLAREHEQ